MDRDGIALATTIVHLASAFGFVTNAVAVLTITKLVDLHTSFVPACFVQRIPAYFSFGRLCAFLAANNSALLLVNSAWYSLPDWQMFNTGSRSSRVVGMISLTLWIVGIRYHLLISMNRLVAIAFPFKWKKFVNVRRTSMAVWVVVLATVVQCSPLLLVNDVWFRFDRSSMQWTFSQSSAGKFFEDYNVNLSNTIELASLLIIDICTLMHLRLYHSKSELQNAISTSAKSKAVEVRLFKQAFSQSLPLLVCFICFAGITPKLTDDFTKFLTTTFVWHVAHGVDGLIIDVFHTRWSLFKKTKTTTTSVVSSSFVVTVT